MSLRVPVRAIAHTREASMVLLAFAVFAVPVGMALAEGAVRVLNCTVTQTCDGVGKCAAATDVVTFRMEPIEIEPDGSGRYTLRYGDVQAAMMASSDLGPYVWSVGQERHALLVSSEHDFLWHRLVVEPVPAATVRFLKCEFRQ
jgi:hypothetical protein